MSRGAVTVLEGGLVEIGKAQSGGFGYMPANRSLSDALPYFYMEAEVLEDGQGLVILGLMHARFVLPADRCASLFCLFELLLRVSVTMSFVTSFFFSLLLECSPLIDRGATQVSRLGRQLRLPRRLWREVSQESV